MSSAKARIKNYRQLLRFRKPIFNRVDSRLSRAHTIYDLRELAKKVTPTGPFDYTDGAAEAEISLNRARRAFDEIEFQPHVLRDVSNVDLTCDFFGKKMHMPVGIAPTGFTRMMNTDGEVSASRIAQLLSIPFALSTMGTTSIENVVKAAPTGSNWFQLYLWRDRDKSLELIHRAQKAGYAGLILTVDAQVAGQRLRDVRNGLTVPPTLSVKTILNAIPRPIWWMNFLFKEPLEFASLESWNGTVAELMNTMFDPTMTFRDLEWIREVWDGTLLVKGIQNADDAKLAMHHGADAIWLSNHGGRQLDRAPVPFELIPAVRKAVGKTAQIHIDTGIMNGADIVAAIAKGANFTWVGRAYLYGLMAGGGRGVSRTFEILETQMIRTMKLLGVNSLKELDASTVKYLSERSK